MKGRRAESDDDTAEHTHLQGCDAECRRDGALKDRRRVKTVAGGIDLAHDLHHRVDGRVHDDVADQTRQSGNLLLLLGHADRNTDRKENRQVVENRAADCVEDLVQAVHERSLTEDSRQVVRAESRLICKDAPESEQDTCHGQQSDRKHEASSDTLQDTENLVFHFLPSLKDVMK